MASPDYADIRASLEFINILENLIKQGGAPAPSQDSPEYGNKGTGWDYASSSPPPEGAQTFITPGGATWWRASATQTAPTSETAAQTRQPSSSLIDSYNSLIGDRVTDADITATWDSGDGSTVRLLAEAKGVRANGETVSESIKNQLAIHQNLHKLVNSNDGNTRSLNEPSEKEDDAGFDWHYFNSDNIDKVKPQSGGANEGSMFKVTMKDGKEFLYKVASGDAKGESYWYSLDRYFGTNISPRIAMMNVGIGPIESAIDEEVGASESIKGLVADKRLDSNPDSSIIRNSIAQRVNWVEDRVNRIKNSSDLGGGHFMEWMDGEPWVTDRDAVMGTAIATRSGDKDFLVSCLDTTSKRESFYAITLYDILLNNYDRNINNFLLSPDRGVVPIDSGAAGRDGIGGESLIRFSEADKSTIIFDTPWRTFSDADRFNGFEALVEKGDSSIEDIEKEMSDFFDRVYDYDKLQEFSRISGLGLADPYESIDSYEMSELLKNEDNKFRDVFVKNISDLIFYRIKKDV